MRHIPPYNHTTTYININIYIYIHKRISHKHKGHIPGIGVKSWFEDPEVEGLR